MLQIKLFVICLFFASNLAIRQITFKNRCHRKIWISPLTNANGAPIGNIRQLNTNAKTTYNIPDSGWGGRFWPKTECDRNGQNCKVGQSMPPCPPKGCQAPAETKVEFFFPRSGQSANVWYDISLVDGYSLPMEIIPNHRSKSCVATYCRLSLNACPTNENHVGNLRVMEKNRIVQCLSPCKKWSFAMHRNEREGIGKDFCCPTPPVSVGQCRRGAVVRTKYVDLIHRTCPSAYSYAYDDKAGLHNCPNLTNFVVNIC